MSSPEGDFLIGDFIAACGTTRDTVRYYEQLGLITPMKSGTYKHYNSQMIIDFQAIKEMQDLGMSLQWIRSVFDLKREKGCGTESFVQAVKEKLHALHQELIDEANQINDRIRRTERLIDELSRVEHGRAD
ncbi:MAG: MerR family transcriptional regulator [Sporolactobacillus sp.]